MDAGNSTVDAVWCVDSETSEQLLLDRKTGMVLARKDRDGNIIDPGTTKC